MDLSGRTLGQFKVLQPLGAGGMGFVYLAEDTRLGRLVALKVLPSEMAGDPDRLERFEREARTLAALEHPNIVVVHSIEEREGLRFLTMERVTGQTLRNLIPKGGLPLPRFFRIAIPLTDALSAAHHRGVTHRDLKPDNVMVTEDGRVKVLDFGLAKVRQAVLAADDEEARTTSVTQDGHILGTVAYMSPEQAQGQPVDARSDIFSLGVLLYEMATGERPFKGSTNLSILSAILKDIPRPVTELKADLPRALGRMIQRALEKNPGDRYQSAHDLDKDLEDLKRDVETGEVLSSRSGAPALVRDRRWPRVGTAVAVLALLFVGAVFLRERSRASARGAAAQAADTRPSVAVFYFENLSGEPALDWLRTGLTDMLVTDLSQTPGIRVLGTAQLRELLVEAGRLEERAPSLETMRGVARKAQVSTALAGSFVRAGDVIRISARLQDAASGEVLSSERVEGPGEAAIFPLVDDLTRRIKGRLKVGAEARVRDRDLKEVTTSSVEAYRNYAEGYELHVRGQEREALPKLEKAVELDPDFAMALAKLAVIHGNLGDDVEAEDYGRRALQHLNRLTARERYYIEGVFYARQADTMEKAIASYQMAVELFPDHMAARNNLAELLLQMGKYDEAIGHLEQLRGEGMPFPATYGLLAMAYAAVGQPEKGLEMLRDFVQQQPVSAGARSYLGLTLACLGRYDEALAVLDEADRLAPGNPEVVRARFDVFALTDRFQEAEAEVARLEASSLPAARWSAAFGRALLHGYAGRVEAAGASLERAVVTLPVSSAKAGDVRLATADFLASLGERSRALQQAREAVKVAKGKMASGGAHAFVGVFLLMKGDSTEARTELETARRLLERAPGPLGESSRHELEGQAAFARGDAARAIEELQKALAPLPRPPMAYYDDRHARIWYTLGEAQLTAGRDREAAEWYRRVVEGGMTRLPSPGRYVRSLYRLGQIHERLGEADLARSFYRRYLSYWKDGTVDRPQVAEAVRRLAAS